jgi:hypothetical protein
MFTGTCNEHVTADCCKRVLRSPLFDFDFGDMWVLCLKRCTRKSRKSKSKRGERRTRFPQSVIVHQISANVSSSEFTFTFIVTIIISVFAPGRYNCHNKCKSEFRRRHVYRNLVCNIPFLTSVCHGFYYD